MATYLLSYDVKDYDISNLLEDFGRGDTVHRWKIKTKKASRGERIFLIKRGAGTKGIFGSGHIFSEPFRDKDLNGKSDGAKKDPLFVMVKFDFIVNPNEKIIIDRDTLFEKFPDNFWDAQGSGNTINHSVVVGLESLWIEKVGGVEIPYPDESGIDEKFIEGGRKLVFVNMYERNPAARMKCIQHHGESCGVCGFHFKSFYGNLGEGYIHVHHLKPISSIGEQYEVDPIEDLRPVCPNCHAMLHKSGSPISIDELQSLINSYGFHPRYKKL